MDPKLFLVTLLSLCVNAQYDCTTSLGNGRCMVLDKCDILKSQLMGQKRDKNFYDLLNKINCGYENIDPKVCCPSTDIEGYTTAVDGKECFTPYGDVGTCTKLEDCKNMADQIPNIQLVSQENMEFIKRSKCTPPGNTKSLYVCCKFESNNGLPSSGTPNPSLVLTDNRIQDKCILSALPPDPDSQCCGIESNSDSRIIGGTETAIDQFPWLVLIDYSRGYSCGGSLISGKYVLTAAHCLVGSQGQDKTAISVRLGEYNTDNSGEDCVEVAGGGKDCTDGDITIPIESYVVHEDYDADQVLQYNDIALIRLNTTVNYTDFIRPICLPRSDFTLSAPDPRSLFISGWGIFDEKQQHASTIKLFAKVPYVEKQKCDERYFKYGRQSLRASQLCVGGEANRDSCKGDSGGPLMLLNNLTYEAVGVISFGTKNCGLENWPSIYTKVYDYLDWIMAHIQP